MVIYMEKENKIIKFQNLLVYYFICSIIGWILETIYGYMEFGRFVDRGFLYGPMCPIYGCGAVLIALIAEFVKKKKVNIVFKFVIIMILFTLLEYFTSLTLELIFQARWWDYSDKFLNLDGRICLSFSLLFGIMGIIFMKFLYEPSKKMINKIRDKMSTNIIWILILFGVIASSVDTVFSVIRYI